MCSRASSLDRHGPEPVTFTRPASGGVSRREWLPGTGGERTGRRAWAFDGHPPGAGRGRSTGNRRANLGVSAV
jgi:hypothetical protein